MDPDMQQPQSQYAAQQQSELPQAIAQYHFWYTTSKYNVFFGQRGIVTLFPGLLVVTNARTRQEVYRYKLAPDLQFSKLPPRAGMAMILFNDGASTKQLLHHYRFYFVNPASISWLGIFGRKDTTAFIASCKIAAGVPQ